MRKALVVMALLALAVPALAQEGPPVDKARQEVITFLALGEQQVTKWDELLAARETATKGLLDQIQGLEEQLQTLLGQAAPDPAAVGALVIQIKGLRALLRPANQAYVDGFEAMLTQDQASKLTAVRRAARLEPLVPAFRLFRLAPPPAAQ